MIDSIVVETMNEQQLLYFGDVEPAYAVYEGKEEREPRKTKREAELDRATLTRERHERAADVFAIALGILEIDFSMEDGQEQRQEHAYEKVEHTR